MVVTSKNSIFWVRFDYGGIENCILRCRSYARNWIGDQENTGLVIMSSLKAVQDKVSNIGFSSFNAKM